MNKMSLGKLLRGFRSGLGSENRMSTSVLPDNSECCWRFMRKRREHTCLRKTCCNLLEQESSYVRRWLRGFDNVIVDWDGVICTYGKPICGAAETVNRFKMVGKQIFLCTNNSTLTQAQYLRKSQELGVDYSLENILCVTKCTASYLKAIHFQKKVYLVGSRGLSEELKNVGIAHTPIGPDLLEGTLDEFLEEEFCRDSEIGAVVVGFDIHFNFCKIVKASTYLKDMECLFVATNGDESYKTPNVIIPCTGSFLSAIETCSERRSYVIGKPNPKLCEGLIKSGKIVPARTLMIGDLCTTDILFGYNCGFQTLLVGTGTHQLEDVERFQNSNDPDMQKLVPDAFLPKLADLLPFIEC